MIQAIADTHTLIWYLLASSHLSDVARDQFQRALKNEATIGFSTVSVVEIIYLVEKGRVRTKALPLLEKKLSQKKQLLELMPLTYGIAQEVQNVPYAQVSDLPDRIIAATALHHNIPLISRDRKIQMSTVKTIW